MKKLVLAYVDSLRTDMLRRAISEGRAPTFGRLVKRGVLIEDCVSSFPSVTPVASAEMVTGVAGDRHWISGMNWYHRVERRYVEYGSSLEASRAFGIFRSLHDLIYNMNLAHLNPGIETVFETLDDRGLRTASTPFLIIYASMPVPCKPSSVPGRRDQYSACCAAELVARNRFDFMLLSFPDNDNYSHRHGPTASVTSIERADLCMADVIRAAGGMDGFLADHALILLADHAHTDVEKPLEIIEGMGRKFDVLRASEDRPGVAEVAVSPTSRAAHIYILEEQENPIRHRRVREQAASIEGVELLSWLERPDGTPLVRKGPGHGGVENLVVVVERGGTQIRFTPAGPGSDLDTLTGGDTVVDRRGRAWIIRGDLEALEASVAGDRIETPVYPDALGRLHSAMLAPHSGDLMVSAALGYECLDWGGAAHIGGGSHGSLRREDSEGPLLFVGCGPDSADERRQWALQDVAPIIRQHFAAA